MSLPTSMTALRFSCVALTSNRGFKRTREV